MAEHKAIDDLTEAEIRHELAELEGVTSRRAGDLRAEYHRELISREARIRNGCCPYCGRRLRDLPTCKYPLLHGVKPAAEEPVG